MFFRNGAVRREPVPELTTYKTSRPEPHSTIDSETHVTFETA